MCCTIPVTANKCFFVSVLTQTTHTHTHSASRLLSANTSLPPPASNCNEVMSAVKWRGFQSGPLLGWPFSRPAVDSTLGGSGRFEALCKNCTNRNVLEDDGICVYAPSASLRPFNPWIQLCLREGKSGLWYDPCYMTHLGFICNTNPPRTIVLSTSWYVISMRGKRPEHKQPGRAPLLPSDPRALVWSLAWTEEIESFHLLVPEGCVVVRIRDEKGDRINAMARQTSAKRYFPA